jgi:hypothetical protein
LARASSISEAEGARDDRGIEAQFFGTCGAHWLSKSAAISSPELRVIEVMVAWKESKPRATKPAKL